MSAIPAIGPAAGTNAQGTGGPAGASDGFKLGSITLGSRLILGTARYPNHDILLRALKAGGAEMVTVAIRRINLDDPTGENLLSLLQRHRFKLLPNTAGCHTVRDAILTAELAREALETNFIKLEIIADEDTLYPDAEKLLDAARQLVAKGFEVLPYCIDDPITCKKLEDIGCVAVMPLGAPIGSGMGVLNPYNFNLIREKVRVPMIVDAGIGTASDVALAMELGCDAALVDTAVAHAVDSVMMADAMRLAVEAGRKARLAGRIPKKNMAQASSPTSGLVQPKRRTG